VIYLVNNGETHSDRQLFYVEAPESFKAWFEEKFLPWVKDRWGGHPNYHLMARAEKMEWWKGKLMTPQEFIEAHRSMEREWYSGELESKIPPWE
jgi:hypothetical protein